MVKCWGVCIWPIFFLKKYIDKNNNHIIKVKDANQLIQYLLFVIVVNDTTDEERIIEDLKLNVY